MAYDAYVEEAQFRFFQRMESYTMGTSEGERDYPWCVACYLTAQDVYHLMISCSSIMQTFVRREMIKGRQRKKNVLPRIRLGTPREDLVTSKVSPLLVDSIHHDRPSAMMTTLPSKVTPFLRECMNISTFAYEGLRFTSRSPATWDTEQKYIQSIIEGFPCCKSLRSLVFDGNPLSSVCIDRLRKTITTLPRLTLVSVRACVLSSKLMKEICDAVRYRDRLVLRIGDNWSWSDDGERAKQRGTLMRIIRDAKAPINVDFDSRRSPFFCFLGPQGQEDTLMLDAQVAEVALRSHPENRELLLRLFPMVDSSRELFAQVGLMMICPLTTCRQIELIFEGLVRHKQHARSMVPAVQDVMVQRRDLSVLAKGLFFLGSLPRGNELSFQVDLLEEACAPFIEKASVVKGLAKVLPDVLRFASPATSLSLLSKADPAYFPVDCMEDLEYRHLRDPDFVRAVNRACFKNILNSLESRGPLVPSPHEPLGKHRREAYFPELKSLAIVITAILSHHPYLFREFFHPSMRGGPLRRFGEIFFAKVKMASTTGSGGNSTVKYLLLRETLRLLLVMYKLSPPGQKVVITGRLKKALTRLCDEYPLQEKNWLRIAHHMDIIDDDPHDVLPAGLPTFNPLTCALSAGMM
eukprot:GEMP01034586.1.p1 GENE.GEMP01034586.1~~GEMP01034586.1.p1  ORF type:complete len:644 (-),score=96.23 GEMP01034586.1:149-2053(-)